MAILLTQVEHGDFQFEQMFSDPRQAQCREVQRTPRALRTSPLP